MKDREDESNDYDDLSESAAGKPLRLLLDACVAYEIDTDEKHVETARKTLDDLEKFIEIKLLPRVESEKRKYRTLRGQECTAYRVLRS